MSKKNQDFLMDDSIVEMLENLPEGMEYGCAIDQIHTNSKIKTRKFPRSHQLVRVTQDEETGEGKVHYSVRSHELQKPDEGYLAELKDILQNEKINNSDIKTEANLIYGDVLYSMNAGAQEGFEPGSWDRSVTYYISFGKDLDIQSVNFSSNLSLMKELLTPRDAVSRFQHDPFNEKLGLWRGVMENYAGKSGIKIEESTGLTTNLLNNRLFQLAMENNIQGICRYKPESPEVKTDRFGFAYSSIEGMKLNTISQAEIASARFPCTKCDDLVGRINLASLYNYKEGKSGIFSDESCERTALFETNKSFLDLTVSFLNTAYDEGLFRRNSL